MTDGVRSPALKGAAFGVTILGFFALGWLGWGTGGHLAVGVQVVVTVAGLVVSAVLALLAWRRWRDTLVPPAPEPGARPSGARFGLIIAAEWIGLGVIAGVLGGTGHTAAIPAVICAGVGLHFIPLAQLFGVRLYYLTALVMCLFAAAAFVVGPSTPALWTLVPGLGAAATLYATCIGLLRWNPFTESKSVAT